MVAFVYAESGNFPKVNTYDETSVREPHTSTTSPIQTSDSLVAQMELVHTQCRTVVTLKFSLLRFPIVLSPMIETIHYTFC